MSFDHPIRKTYNEEFHGMGYTGASFCCAGIGDGKVDTVSLDCKIYAHINCFYCYGCSREFHVYVTGPKGTVNSPQDKFHHKVSFDQKLYKQVADTIEENKKESSSGEIAIIILNLISEQNKKNE